jgi:hypothetical protein
MNLLKRRTAFTRLAIISAALAAIGAGGRLAWQHLPTRAPRAEIPAVTNVGRIPEGVETVATIPIANTGGAPLRIEGVRAQCGCAEVRLDRHVIPPQATGTLQVVVRAIEGLEISPLEIAIRTNDPASPVAAASLLFEPGSDLRIEPDMVILGRISQEELPVRRSILVDAAASAADLQAFELAATSGCEWLRMAAPRNARRSAVELSFELQQGAPSGALDTFVDVHLSARQLVFRIPVTATIAGRVQAQPQRLTLHDGDLATAAGGSRPRVQFIASQTPHECCRVVQWKLAGDVARVLEMELDATDASCLLAVPRRMKEAEYSRIIRELPRPVVGQLIATVAEAAGAPRQQMVPIKYYADRQPRNAAPRNAAPRNAAPRNAAPRNAAPRAGQPGAPRRPAGLLMPDSPLCQSAWYNGARRPHDSSGCLQETTALSVHHGAHASLNCALWRPFWQPTLRRRHQPRSARASPSRKWRIWPRAPRCCKRASLTFIPLIRRWREPLPRCRWCCAARAPIGKIGCKLACRGQS